MTVPLLIADPEDKSFKNLVLEKGKKWSEIAKILNGRNENSVKNRFNSILKKEKGLTEELISEYSF